MRSTGALRTLCGLLALASALVFAATAGAEWSQYRGDAGRTAHASWAAPGGPAGIVAWRAEIGDGAMVDASPVIHPVTRDVYVGTVAGNALAPSPGLLAFSSTGQLRWSASLDGYGVRAAPAMRPGGFPVVLGHRTVSIIDHRDGGSERSWDSRERAFLLDPLTGEIVRRSAEWGRGEAPTFRAAPVVDESRDQILVRTPSGLTVLDPLLREVAHVKTWVGATGTSGLSWEELPCLHFFCVEFDPSATAAPSAEPPLPRLPSPAYSEACDDVVFAYPQASRAARNTGRGRFQPPSLLTTPALGKAGVLYAVAADGDTAYLEAYDQSGERRWRTVPLAPGPVSPPALGSAVGRGGPTATCTRIRGGTTTTVRDHRGETVYVAAGLSLHAFDGDGNLLWRRDPGGSRLGEPVVVATAGGDELVVVASNGASPSLVAYRTDGTLAWRVVLDGEALGSPAIADGTIYVATTRSLYAIR